MSEFPKTFPLTKIIQFTKEFYIGNIRFSQLKDLYKFSIRSDENLEGFNRATDENKINKIVDFISENQEKMSKSQGPKYPIFVTPIILGLSTDGEKIRLNGNILEINSQIEVSEQALVVDGQHRLKGIEKWVGGGLSQNDIEIPVVFLLDYSEFELAEIFAKVNFTQKPVNKSLYYDIFGASPFMPISEIRITHILLKELNEKFKNDFNIDFIKMLPNSIGTISQGFFGDKLSKLLEKEFVYKQYYQNIEQKYKDFEKDAISEQEIKKDDSFIFIKADLEQYFMAVHNVFGNKGIIYKTNGIGALLLLLEDFHLCDKKNYQNELDKLGNKQIFELENYKSGSESTQKVLYRELSKNILFSYELENFNQQKETIIDIKNYKIESFNNLESKRVLEVNKRFFRHLYDINKIEYLNGGLYKVIS